MKTGILLKNMKVQTHRMYNRSVNLGSSCVRTSPPVVTQGPRWCEEGRLCPCGEEVSGNLCAFPPFCSEPETTLRKV